MSVALLFSPQGSQEVGMGRALAEESSRARAVFERADRALAWSVSTTCWEGPPDRLNDTRQTQPCLLTTSVACLEALREAAARGAVRLEPKRVAGHSVGEYAALVAAGALDFTDALRLVALRGELMAAAGVDGGMAAVIGLDRPAVSAIVDGIADLVVANDNAPGQVVISGSRAALDLASAALREAGARRTISLNVSGPFHSPLMSDVGRALSRAFDEVAWAAANPPVVSNVSGAAVEGPGELRDLLARQVSAPVEWVASVRNMRADGIDTFIECGPGTALSGMVRRIAPDATALNAADPASVAAVVEHLAGAAQPATATTPA